MRPPHLALRPPAAAPPYPVSGRLDPPGGYRSALRGRPPPGFRPRSRAPRTPDPPGGLPLGRAWPPAASVPASLSSPPDPLGLAAAPAGWGEQRLAQVLQEVLAVVVARQPGDAGEAVALVEAAVSGRVGAAEVAAGRSGRRGPLAEQLEQPAAHAAAALGPGHQDVPEPGGAGDHLADRDRHQLVAVARLDHHRPAGPVEDVRAENVAVRRRPP